MSQYSFQMYLNSLLYISILISSCLSQKKWPVGTLPFPKEKCESLLTGCSCYDYYKKAAIVCNNTRNFTNFNRILQSGDIFEVGTTYDLTFTGVEHVPSGVLKGLGVYRFILDDPDVTVDENILEGVARLERFHVRLSSIKDIPDFSIVKDSIRKINIDSSRLESLQGTNLQYLTAIDKLSFVNNTIRFIDPDVFKGTESVTILDLSHNLLTSIPSKLLDPMVNLTKFAVSSNNLLHVNGLFSVTHPKFIYLDFNNITDVDSVLPFNMDRTTTLVLASNPIEKVSANSFNGKITNVKFLYLDHCRIREFNVSHYRFERLATLDLSYNLIEEIPNQKIDIGKYLELDLIGNQIRKFEAKISGVSMKRLYLSQNKLRILNTTLQYTQLEEVQVSRNQLQYLTNQDLRAAHGTSNLEFQENQISRIDTRTFEPVSNDLHYLDLSFNLITSLNRSMRLMSQLKLLNLSNNLIETFAIDEFTGLNELSELYLQYNKIKAIGQLQYLERLQYLVITHNNVELITPDQVPRKLRFMYLADNPLKCTCHFQPFLLWLNTSESPATDVDLCLKHVTENNLLSSALKCPSMCLCACANYDNEYFMSVDCSSKNLSDVPEFLKNDFLQRNTTFDYRHPLIMDQNVHPSLHIEDCALGINLENNSLEFSSLEKAQTLPNLVELYLANNRLRQLPMHMMDNLRRIKKMSLSGNPWDCSCNALRFKKWLTSKNDVVQDRNNTRCATSSNGETKLKDRVIWTLTDLDICPADVGLYVSLTFGVLIILLIGLASKVLYTKYELNIKVFLYSRGFTFMKAEDLDYDKEFDAFLSFSHQDDAFVSKEIISVIEEKDPNIRLCIHYRHFIAGEYIHDNIIRAVQNSKRTVFILTREFLESYWCVMEFQTAHIQALEDKVHRIIVIKVGDLPEEIDPKIKVYLDSTTYLTWGEKHFWQKLMYVLPTRSTPRVPDPIDKSQSVTELREYIRKVWSEAESNRNFIAVSS